MKLLIVGKGKMGNVFKSLYEDDVTLVDNETIFNLENNYDGVIDFSHPSLIHLTLSYCLKHHLPLVIGTTSYSEQQISLIEKASKIIPICIDSNYSLGILNLKKCIESLVSFHFDKIVITEIHHIDKIDSPSGTAKTLKNFIKRIFLKEVEIISYREKDVFGMHKIEFINQEESICLIHDAKNRSIFAKGAVVALDYIKNKKPKLYDFKEIIDGK